MDMEERCNKQKVIAKKIKQNETSSKPRVLKPEERQCLTTKPWTQSSPDPEASTVVSDYETVEGLSPTETKLR